MWALLFPSTIVFTRASIIIKIILNLEENLFQDNFYVSVKNTDGENLSVPFLQVLQFYQYLIGEKNKMIGD